jgi:hypothetical protein
MWDVMGTKYKGPTSNGQPDDDDLEDGCGGRNLVHPQSWFNLWPPTAILSFTRVTKENPPW